MLSSIFVFLLLFLSMGNANSKRALFRVPSCAKPIAALTFTIFTATNAFAVSGGGYDYATKDLKGESFIGKVLKEKVGNSHLAL